MSTKCGSMCGVFACGMVNLLMIIMCLKLALVSYIDYNPFQLKNDTFGCRGKLVPIWKRVLQQLYCEY